jgi:hypothetical protein
MASLYERLGSPDAITAVVDSFASRCAGDEIVEVESPETGTQLPETYQAATGPGTPARRDSRSTSPPMQQSTTASATPNADSFGELGFPARRSE